MATKSSVTFPAIGLGNESGGLADHFLECGRVGRYLTVADESRFVISDDFGPLHTPSRITAAAASVFSRDDLVGRAALFPLGLRAGCLMDHRREAYEELFSLIERNAFSPVVRDTAHSILEAGFRDSRIRELEAELGGAVSPARKRYRAFLGIVRQLMDGGISVTDFRDEFLAFTRAVAGKLDFGIYGFCLDRIFSNDRVSLNAKGALVAEVLLFPPLIRREILASLLSTPGQRRELVEFTRSLIEQDLDNETVVEIYLLVTLKSSRLSVDSFEELLRTNPDAALTTLSAEASPSGLA